MLENRRNKVILTAYSSLGLMALFTVPYYFSGASPRALSASFDYGFNNKIGTLILFLLCLGLVIFAQAEGRKSKAGMDYDVLASQGGHELDKIFKICMILQIMCCLAVWFIMRDTFGAGESWYFIPRLHDLIIGRKLYTEIDFAYGPLLLYIPLYLYRAVSTFFPIRIQDAYFLSMSLMQCIGFYGFCRIFNRVKWGGGVLKVQ